MGSFSASLNKRKVEHLLTVTALFCWAYVIYLAILYLIYPGYMDHGESVNTLIAQRLLEGRQVYPSFDAPGRISNLYGPFFYIISAAFMALAGASLEVGKAAPLVGVVMVPLLVFMGQRDRGRIVASAAVMLATGFILLHTPMSVWNRPDSLLVMLVAAAVWLANSGQKGGKDVVWRAVAIAALAGVGVGMKIHGAIYFIPVILFFCYRRPLKIFFLMCGVGLGVIFLPFAFPSFSLSGYLSWFGPISGKENSLGMIKRILRYSVFYLFPVVLFFLAKAEKDPSSTGTGKGDVIYVMSYIFSFALLIFPASKVGAGDYYMLPFAPVAIDMAMRYGTLIKKHRRLGQGLIALSTVALLAISIPVQKRFHRALHWKEVSAIRGELRKIMSLYPGKSIEMGLGQDVISYRRTFYKTDLVLAGNPFTIDGAIMIETSALGYPLSDETIDMIRNCSTDIWLIPSGDRPFEMIGYYGNKVFSDRFRNAFLASYEKQRSFHFFDAWGCRFKK